MPVAPEIAELLTAFNAQPPMHAVPLELLRQPRERIGATDFQPVEIVEDRTIPAGATGLPIRFYSRRPVAGEKRPLVLVFHGGGFVFGGIDGYYDHVCRVLCAEADCRVISVGYRLAPENKFPAATDDGYAALEWAAAHADELGADPARLFVAGGSAGANLAAATALRTRDCRGPALLGQLLFYPFVGFHTPPTGSLSAYADGYYLTRADVVWFWKQYLPSEADAENPYAVPLRAASLAGLPPALIITAEYDPLRDDGERYAERLREDGVPVTLTRYAGMVHGFMAFPTDQASIALRQGVNWIESLAGGADVTQ